MARRVILTRHAYLAAVTLDELLRNEQSNPGPDCGTSGKKRLKYSRQVG